MTTVDEAKAAIADFTDRPGSGYGCPGCIEVSYRESYVMDPPPSQATGWHHQPDRAGWIKKCPATLAERPYAWIAEIQPEKLAEFMTAHQDPFALDELKELL